ncbi:MAG: DinB family protein [Actinomycetota bacterium]
MAEERGFPTGHDDERELYLDWLRYLRDSVVQKVDGLSEAQARWQPDGRLLPLLGIVNHLTHVEWRWIDGGFRGADVRRSDDEFRPGPELTADAVIASYRRRARETDDVVRVTPLDAPCARGEGLDLRWVLVHLVNETARHAGHADATRELLDGFVGE